MAGRMVFVATALLLAVAMLALNLPDSGARTAPSDRDQPLFRDVTLESGLHFARDKVTGEYRIVNIYEGGVAVADVDGDGWEDVYFTQTASSPDWLGSVLASGNQLFRNQGDGSFIDATRESGLDTATISHGAVFGDYDNDGDPDLFVANYGPNQLFENIGDGVFEDVSVASGIAEDPCFNPCWSSSAVWADIDNDGLLDLYVMTFRQQGRVVDWGGPPATNAEMGMRNLLYHNQGDGTFEEIAALAGVTDPNAEGWMPGFADYDHDGDLDLFLANDVTHNRLFRNDGDLTFTDVTEEAGIPYGYTSMGMVWADFDNDLDFDILATEYRGIPTTYLINNDDGTFTDVSGSRGLYTSTPITGWGVNALDYDFDGDLDLFLANGDADALDPFDHGNNFYRNIGGFVFDDITPESGTAGHTYARGSALFDYDRDGDDDIVLTSSEGPALLFRNDAPKRGESVQLRFEAVTGNRDASGAEFYITTSDRVQLRQVTTGDSFEANGSPWYTVGLRDDTTASVTVHWLGGGTDTVTVEGGNRYWVREGVGIVAEHSGPYLNG